MQPHFLGAGENSSGKCKLHHRLAARYRQAATKAAERRCEVAKPTEHLIGRNIGAVLEVPGVRVVAVCTSQEASRDEKHDTQARTVVARRGFIGVAVSE